MAQLKGSTTVGGYSPITKKTLMSILKILDGHGSGLDADLLDGLHASDFSRSNHTHSYLPLSGGTLSGKLTVNSHIEITGSGNNITLPNNYGIAGRQTDGVSKYMLFMSSNNVIHIGHENGNQVNIDCTSPTIRGGHKIYHQGFKPSPADIGAAASSHGTHVSYGGNGSATTVSRSDHSHDTIVTRNVTDWNSATGNGFLQGEAKPNAPEASGWFWGFRMQHGGAGYGGQIAIGNNTNRMYFRSQNEAGSGTWNRVYHTGNKPSPADIGAAASSHGTHVSYGGNGSATTVSRSDHSHININTSGRIAMHTGTTLPPSVGISMIESYNNGYPTPYGHALTLRGSSNGNSMTQLYMEWAGSTSTRVGGLYYRSKSDVGSTPYSGWTQLYTTSHKPTATDVGARPSNWVPSWNDVTGKPSTFTPASHSHNDLYYTESEMNTKLNEKLNLNGSGAMTGRLALSAAGMTFPASGGNWISGKTTTNVINVTGNALDTYYPILKYTTNAGHVANIGAIDDKFGFFGYNKDQTTNGTSSHAYLNVASNTFISGYFQGDGSKLTNVNAIKLHGRSMNEGVEATTIVSRDAYADVTARLFKCNYMNQSKISGAIAYRVNNTNDPHIRFCSDGNAVRSWIGAAPVSHTHGYMSSGGTYDTVIFNNWVRTTGNTGWYNGTHGGGMYMTDSTWVQVSHGKSLLCTNKIKGKWLESDGSIILHSGSVQCKGPTNSSGSVGFYYNNTLKGHIQVVKNTIYSKVGDWLTIYGVDEKGFSDPVINISSYGTNDVAFSANLHPTSTNDRGIGFSTNRWKQLYCTASPNVSSDISVKNNVKYIDANVQRVKRDVAIKLDKSNMSINYGDCKSFIRDLPFASYYYNNYKEVKVKDDEAKQMIPTKSTDSDYNIGFVAQDIAETKVGKNLLTQNEDGTLAYNLGSYISIIGKATQETIHDVDNIIKENMNLKNEINILKTEIKEIKQRLLGK